jgi:hypothetical protein
VQKQKIGTITLPRKTAHTALYTSNFVWLFQAVSLPSDLLRLILDKQKTITVVLRGKYSYSIAT